MNRVPRVAIFYDGNYLLHCSNYYAYIHSHHRRISIGGLHNFVCGTISRSLGVDVGGISQAHYFRGRLGAADALARGNQLYNDRVFDDILMAEGIQTHYLPLRGVGTKREESGTTVALALTAAHLAVIKEIDIAVLVIADTDYVPLMRALHAYGVDTMIVGWEFEYTNDDGVRMTTRTSAELLGLATYPLAMSDIIECGIAAGDALVEGLFVNSSEAKITTLDESDDVIDNGNGRMTSTVLNIKNGFGFIKYPNNNLFFHSADVEGCDFGELRIGDSVEFEIGISDQGQEVARHIVRVASS